MDGRSKLWRCGVQRWQYGFAVPGRDLFEALGASVRWDGQESESWLEEGRHQEIRVPGQQIFCRQDDRVRSLSKPGDEQADYPLSLSPDGPYLAMQRLNYIDLGALYLMNLRDGQMVKLMDNVQANAGYYGNYYPDGVSIYWIEKI